MPSEEDPTRGNAPGNNAMEDDSNIPTINCTYLEELSVIPSDGRYQPPKENRRGCFLSVVLSLVLHLLLALVISLPAFSSPAMVVSNEPTCIWLIPFLSSADIRSEEHVISRVKRYDAAEPVSEETREVVDLPAEVTPPATDAQAGAIPVDAESLDTDLMVLKQHHPPKRPSKPRQPKPVRMAAQVTPPVNSPKPQPPKSAPLEPSVAPSGLQSPISSAKVPASGDSPAVVETPQPMKNVAKPLVKSGEEARGQVAAPREQIRKIADATLPASAPLPTPVPAALPQVPSQRKSDNRKPAPALPVPGTDTPITTGIAKSFSTEPRNSTLKTSRQPVPAAANVDIPREIIAPKVTGDIKLIVSGATVADITITFQELAVKRRNRPLSRTEVRHPVIVTPLVRSQNGESQYIVVKAREGIYNIKLFAKDVASGSRCQLKVFEGKAREKTRSIDASRGDDTGWVVKLLMPDGVIWDDDSAFTGSLEDSDSITKFNSDTGLTWKEYR